MSVRPCSHSGQYFCVCSSTWGDPIGLRLCYSVMLIVIRKSQVEESIETSWRLGYALAKAPHLIQLVFRGRCCISTCHLTNTRVTTDVRLDPINNRDVFLTVRTLSLCITTLSGPLQIHTICRCHYPLKASADD